MSSPFASPQRRDDREVADGAALLPVPGRRPDDDSIAGEEDPGASVDMQTPPPAPVGPAPGSDKPAAR